MNEQINQVVQVMTTMMVLSMGFGMVKPVMLQTGQRGRGEPKSIVERAASHFNVPVSEVKTWMVEEVKKIERGTGLGRGTYAQVSWLTPSQRDELERKYGFAETSWAEQMAPRGNFEACEKLAKYFAERMGVI